MFFKLKKSKILDNRGGALLFVVVFGAISFAFVVTALSGFAMYQNRLAVSKHNREMAFQIAEAGVAYYRWHIYHDEDDFQDGTATSGPYLHLYNDKNGKEIGKFSLELTAPRFGSTVSTIKSIGWLDIQPGSRRTIKARVGKPSLTDFAFLTNSGIWIGDMEAVHGKMHSNFGIRFDGTTDAPVTNFTATYTCPSSQGCSGSPTKTGVWGTGGPTTFFKYPTPFRDFGLITNKLTEIENRADSTGIYLDSSSSVGWHIVFSTTTAEGQEVGQVQIYTVDSYKTGNGCYSFFNRCQNTSGATLSQSECCRDINVQTLFLTTTTPTSGYFYSEKDVWVNGTVKGSVVVGSDDDIIIAGNINYSERSEENIIGLVAKKDVLIPYESPNNLEINACMMAQTGAVQRFNYPSGSYRLRNSIKVNGSVVSANIWTFTWVSGPTITSGYQTTETTFNVYSLFNPPPSSPVGADYALIEWQEVK